MKTPVYLLPLLILLLLFGSDARAALNPAIVPADAQWVLYADVNALRQSALGRQMMAMMQEKMQPGPQASGVQFDFQRLFATIGNVTAFGSAFTSEATIDGALVIEGTGDLRKIAEGYAAQASLMNPKEVRETKDLPFSGYVLGKDLMIGFPPEPIILLGKSAAELIKARDTFRGQAQSLAQAPGSAIGQLVGKTGNAYAVAASLIPPQFSTVNAPQARIVQLLQSGLITVGEDGQKTVAHADLNAKDDASAEKLAKIVQGLAAMMSLTETSDRQLTEFLQSAVVDKHDRTVSVQVSYSSDRLAQMFRTLSQHSPASAAGPVQIRKDFGGTVVAEWKLDGAPAGAAPSQATLADRSIPSVHLVTGATITIGGQRATRGGPNNALLDSVEIFPMGGGPGLRFEAENMKLRGYVPRAASWASGGKLVGHYGNWASAQFEFPGAEGDYMIHVRYVDESAGTSTISVAVTPPAPSQNQR